MLVPLSDLSHEHAPYASELQAAIDAAWKSGSYIGGGAVEALERELADYLHLSPWSVVSCANGSDALLLSLLALDLPKGSEVIVATHNYVAAAEAVLHLGMTPIWADVTAPHCDTGCKGGDLRANYQIETSARYLETLFTPRTKALIAVNMYGSPCDATAIDLFCREHHIPWIEDNAQGMGGVARAMDSSAPLGTRATMGTTSFFPTKPLGCMGDGGAVFVPRHKELADKVRQLSRHGQRERYHFVLCGINSRLDALQAAILRVKLRHLDEANRARARTADLYDLRLGALPGIQLPHRSGATTEAMYLYTITVPPSWRPDLLAALRSAQIDARVYYPNMLHRIKAFNRLPAKHPCPNADLLGEKMLSLPVAPTTSEDQANYVCEVIERTIADLIKRDTLT